MGIRRGRATVTRERRPLGDEPATGETWEGCGAPRDHREARRPASGPHRQHALREKRSHQCALTLRATLAAACAAGLVAAPAAAALDTTIRVEGGSANLDPRERDPDRGRGHGDGLRQQLRPGRRQPRLGLLAALPRHLEHRPRPRLRATSRPSPPCSCRRSARTPNAGRRRLAVPGQPRRPAGRRRATPPSPRATGRSGTTAAPTARGSSTSRPRPTAWPPAARFTVAVTSYAADGAAQPGAGAAVTLRRRRAPRPTPPGRRPSSPRARARRPCSATRAGDIRSAARPVCSFARRPDGLQPAAAAAAGSRAGRGGSGARRPVAPGSRIPTRASAPATATVRAIRGVAGPDRSDVAAVEVALARRVGTQCRFRTRSGGLTAPPAVLAPALPDGALAWAATGSLGLGKGLAPGHLARLEPRDRRRRQPRGASACRASTAGSSGSARARR